MTEEWGTQHTLLGALSGAGASDEVRAAVERTYQPVTAAEADTAQELADGSTVKVNARSYFGGRLYLVGQLSCPQIVDRIMIGTPPWTDLTELTIERASNLAAVRFQGWVTLPGSEMHHATLLIRTLDHTVFRVPVAFEHAVTTGDPAAGPLDGLEWRWFGSPTARVRLGGASNRMAFIDGLSLLEPDVAAGLAVLHGPFDDARYWPQLEADEGTTVIVWGGNEHNLIFLIPAEPVTTVAPNQAAPAEVNGSLVPYRMLAPLWESSMRALKETLDRFADPDRLLVVGTPPPSSNDHIKAALVLYEPVFAPLLAHHGYTPATVPVCELETRIAQWQSLQESLEQTARDSGVAFLPVPEWVRGPDGALRAELCARDATHGNGEYGRLMWLEILRHLGQAEA